MSRSLSSYSLEPLKKEAKRWLKALRAGDSQATRRFQAIHPSAPGNPGLRDVQLALAREFGLPGWTALKDRLGELALSQLPTEELVDIVLRSAWMGDVDAAKRILARSPELSSANIFTAIVTGNQAAFEQHLTRDPDLARRTGGPLNWPPLLYLAYARLAGGDDDRAVDMARTLLDRGADPNARFDDGWGNYFTVLTGVIGEGEGDKPAHPQAPALADLLIERGARPYDTQSLYNTSITRDEVRWLDFLWKHCEAQGALHEWRKVPQPGLGGRVPLNALDYLLGNAVAFQHPERARWLLEHGANADGVHAYSGRKLREEALIAGYVGMADLLVQYGAVPTPLEGAMAFQAACMALDRAAARDLSRRYPEYLLDATPMLNAARQGRAGVVALLLDVGMDVDVADETDQRGIQNAVLGNSIDVIRLLVANGAEIDRPTTRYDGAMGFAAEFGRREIAEILAPHSRDIFNITYLGMGARLRELLDDDPSRANAVHPRAGVTPLFFLPGDEDAAVEMTELLIAYGAKPEFNDKDGRTAEDIARRRGLVDAADRMREETNARAP